MENETIFADGVWFNKPHANAPDFVKGNVSFEVAKAIKFLQDNAKEDRVSIDLLKSKAGDKLYFKLNTFEPKKDTTPHTQSVEDKAKNYPQEEGIDAANIPFN